MALFLNKYVFVLAFAMNIAFTTLVILLPLKPERSNDSGDSPDWNRSHVCRYCGALTLRNILKWNRSKSNNERGVALTINVWSRWVTRHRVARGMRFVGCIPYMDEAVTGPGLSPAFYCGRNVRYVQIAYLHHISLYRDTAVRNNLQMQLSQTKIFKTTETETVEIFFTFTRYNWICLTSSVCMYVVG